MANKTIIQHDNMTQEEIQNSINKYLKQNEDYTSLEGFKGTDIVTELLAGFGSYISYNNQTLREETYVETVKSQTSIAMLAIDYSFRINRPTSPKLLLEYTGSFPKTIFKGDIFGTYEGMSLVYIGESTSISTGSTFEVSIGELKKTTITIDKTDNIWMVDLKPTSRNYIENSILDISSNQVHSRVVTRLEDLYLGNAVDFSLGNNSSRIYLYDAKLEKGFSTPEFGDVTIIYLEIDGAFTFVNSKAQMLKEFKLNTILSQGADADDLFYVKSILPFFNQTFRTAVSPFDYNYIVKNFSYFKDASYLFDVGTPLRVRLNLTGMTLGDVYTLTFYSNKGSYKDNPRTEEYEVEVLADDTYDSIVARFISIIEAQTSLVELVYPAVGTIFRVQALKPSSELQIYISHNIDMLIEIENRLPNQYLGYIYYTHKQIEQDINELTYYEQQQFKNFFEPHKISGSVVALVPAAKQGFNFELNVKLLGEEYTTVFNTLLYNYLSEYQYTLNKDFSIKKSLRDIALFSYNGVRFVTGVFSSTSEDYNGYIDRYLFLNKSIDISYNY